MLTFDQVKELIDLIADKRLGELEIETSGYRLRIAGLPPTGPPAGPSTAATTVGGNPAAFSDPERSTEPAAAASDPARHLLTSPIVGTFYAAPSPDAEPYVRPGQRVTRGQVVCIVEAMKLMNEIESDVDGTVREVLPDNAQPVEFGTPLLAIELD